jgi:hypothetical protein
MRLSSITRHPDARSDTAIARGDQLAWAGHQGLTSVVNRAGIEVVPLAAHRCCPS